MSRIRKLAHSLFSGYLLLGVNTLYTLASVPLAVRYLDKKEFGLWALTSTIAQYIGQIDLGMTGTSRILIDYKDQKEEGSYGSVIQTFFLVSAVQGALVFLLGIGLAVGLAPVLHIPADQQRHFIYLTIGQCALLAAGFFSRVLNFLLWAHQRYDLTNYAQALCFGVSYGVLWFGFHKHQGVYSTLWAQLAAWLLATVLAWVWSAKLQLFPRSGCWGRATWSRFRELFVFGRDVFLVALGFQLINSSQNVVLTWGLGLEMAGVWSVCLRPFNMLGMVIFRLFEYASAAFAEMIVRGEKELLYRRFRSIVVLSVSLSVVTGTIFSVCNQPFIQIWTAKKFGWPPLNDVLLAVWLILLAAARCHLGLVGQTKQFRAMRYLYLVEGSFFVGCAFLTVRHWGITGMLLASIAGTLLFSLPYGTWRSSRYFGVSWPTVAVDWWLPSLRLAVGLVPVAVVVWWATDTMPAMARLVSRGLITGLAGAVLLLRLGLDQNLRSELRQRAPKRLQPLVGSVLGLA